MTVVYYDAFKNNSKKIIYAYTKNGICFVGTPNKNISELYDFITPDKLIEQEDPIIKDELTAYLNGTQTTFDLPIDLSWSTAFQQKVYQTLMQIEYGRVINYSELAIKINKPTATRSVASAVAKNPILFVIPCHRVLRKDGSLGGFRAGTPFKQELLTLESK